MEHYTVAMKPTLYFNSSALSCRGLYEFEAG